ncbi:MAG TPA: hypothetical protein V6D08_06265 [Candidatus Obscuribacterales bacterium]
MDLRQRLPVRWGVQPLTFYVEVCERISALRHTAVFKPEERSLPICVKLIRELTSRCDELLVPADVGVIKDIKGLRAIVWVRSPDLPSRPVAKLDQTASPVPL